MTGYQEIMTDPSYARQIVTFTFPHIGNVGATTRIWSRQSLGAGLRRPPGRDPSEQLPGGAGLRRMDARQRPHRPFRRRHRALTRRIRVGGAPNGVIAHSVQGRFDVEALLAQAREWPGLEGMDLAKEVSCRQMYCWAGGRWRLGQGYAEHDEDDSRPHVAAIDYGSKRNIFRNLADAGARVTVLPAAATFEEVMAHEPDGLFLSNGPRATLRRPAHMRCR